MKTSISEPPERHRRPASAVRRVESALAIGLVGIMVTLWAIGERSKEAAMLDSSLPIAGGGASSLVALLFLMLLYAAFQSAEVAMDLLRPVHVRLVREKNPRQAEALQRILDRRGTYIAACAFGADLSRIALVFVGFILAPGVAVWLESQFQLEYNYSSLLLSSLLVAIPVSLLNLVLALVPRTYASLNPHVMALRLLPIVRTSSFLFFIPSVLVTSLANLFTARFGAKATFALANQAEEEIKTLVESAQESGEIEVDEKELLHSVFEFSDTVAREVMTPRVDLDSMPANSDPKDVLKVIQESGHSRIPLFEDTDDQIVGIIHAKDLLTAMINGGNINLRRLMRQPHFVPENKNLHDLLAELRSKKSQMAIVQDEYGGTAGVVTIEDIVEELVGDIVDEYDNEEPEVVAKDEGWLIDGRTHLDDVNDEIQSKFESEEFDTVGGFVFGLFGRQPSVGEYVEHGGYRFEVARTDGRRIAQLAVSKLSDSLAEFENQMP